MPGHLAGTMGMLGHHASHVVVAFLTGRQIVVGLVIIAVIVILLVGPVVGEILMDSFSVNAEKAAKPTFLTGAATLILGLISGVPALDIIGLCLIGAVVLGWLLINYLGPARRWPGW